MRRILLTATLVVAFDSVGHAQQQAASPPAVLVKPVALRNVARESDFVGKIEAAQRVELQPRVSGFLAAPKFKDGERVKSGQLLYVIEQAPYQAAVDSKAASLASAKAGALNAEISLERAQELVRNNTGTRVALDQAKANSAQADAAVQMAEAALTDAKITFSYTEIRAPIDGRIGRTSITEGNLVTPQSGPLTVIVNDDQMRAVFQVSQREVLEYKKRNETREPVVRLKLADGSIYGQTGKVGYIDNVVDSRTDGQVLRATFENPNGELTHGQTVRVSIEQPADKKSLVIPQVALSADQTGTFAMVVDASNVASVRYVKVEQTSGEDAVVSEGLKEGEMVIVQGLQRVRPGMKVETQTSATAK